MSEYISLFTILFILAIGGIAIFLNFYKTQNKLLLLGGGMVAGPLFFLLILSSFVYIFKGIIAVRLLFLMYIILSFFLIKKSKLRSEIINVFHIKYRKNFLIISLIAFYLTLIVLTLPNANVGPDNYIYSGIASSFARGNYPTVLPWQPNFLTIYHFGTFALEGAVESIFNIGFGLTNYIFSGYLIFAMFFMLTGLMREKTRSILCLIPAVFGLFLYGGPILIFSGIGNLLNSIFTSSSLSSLIHSLSLYPQLSDFRHPNGGGPAQLADLAFINFTTFGLASMILFFILLFDGFREKKIIFKYIVLTIILNLVLSIDETIFLILFPTFIFKLILDYRKQKILEIVKLLACGVVFIALFFTIQNPVRDSFLTPSKEYPRFLFLTPLDSVYPIPSKDNSTESEVHKIAIQMTQRSASLNNLELKIEGTKWDLLDWHLVIFLVILLAIMIRSKWALVIGMSAVFSYAFGLTLTNTYWPANFERFFNLTYIFTTIGIGFLVADLYLKKKMYFLISTAIVFLLLPQLITAHARYIDKANLSGYAALRDENGFDVILENISNTIPYNTTIAFIDGYPYSGKSSYINMRAATKFGLFVPMSPPNNKVLTPDDEGVEFYDLMTNLSPTSTRELNLDYIFVVNEDRKYLSETRQKQLDNAIYFTPKLTNSYGTLYQINKDFKNINDDQMTLKQITDQIPNGKNVYIDNFYTNYIPKAIILQLAKRTNLIGFPHANGGGNFMLIETYLPYNSVCASYNYNYELQKCNPGDYPPVEKYVKNIDYMLLDPSTDPKLVYSGQWKKITEVPYVTLWETGK